MTKIPSLQLVGSTPLPSPSDRYVHKTCTVTSPDATSGKTSAELFKVNLLQDPRCALGPQDSQKLTGFYLMGGTQ